VKHVRNSICALVLAASAVSRTAGAEVPTSTPTRRVTLAAEQLVFLLQYVGSDYAAAVKDGRIVDDAEYRENREFAVSIAERFADLRREVPPAKLAGIEAPITKLRDLVETRGDPRAVKELSEAAIPRLIEAFDLRSYPRERPDARRARALYAENCASCHGPRGASDGPRAKELDPPPARFDDLERMSTTAPYVFYNAITLGVANTAMASFSDAFSDQERWDLAFYLWTFASPERDASEESPSPRPTPRIVLSLRDLATRSSVALAPEMIRQAAGRGEILDAAEAIRGIARLRADPPMVSDAEERLARLRQDLGRSVSLVERGDTDTATDAVTTAYLSEFEPLEPELDRRDPRIRQTFEQGLIDFRTALRRNDRAAALATARVLETTVDRAAAVLADRSANRGSVSKVAISAVIGAALILGGIAAWRIGNRRRLS
jgi:high-affinity iron transporter